jgi:hypothetical protein
MAAAQKSYFLVPDYDIPPGALALGDILLDPTEPRTILNAANRIPIASEDARKTYKTDWAAMFGRVCEGKFGLRASSLQMLLGLGGDVDLNWKSDTVMAFTFQRLETEDFQPDDTYVEAAMRTPGITSFLKAHPGMFVPPKLYMVTGIKVARGATAKSMRLQGIGGGASIGFDGTGAGIPVAVGPAAELLKRRKEEVSFGASSDFVFAFRLSKVRYNAKRGVTYKDHRKGALLDREVADKNEEVVEVMGVEERDIGIGDFEGQVGEVIGEDGERYCVASACEP